MTQKSTLLLGFGLHADAHGDDPDWRGFWSGLIDRLDGAAEFLTLEDRFADPGRDGLDAILLANWLAPRSRGIGIIAGVPLNFVEPFHVSTAVATLDYVSAGRAGLLIQRLDQQRSRDAGRAIGALKGFPALDPPSLDSDALAATEVVRRLWDSWEGDAVIRDVTSQRYVDGEKLHYIDFQSADFRVLGPSITPRPPQGQPLVALGWTTEGDLALARAADVVFVPSGTGFAGVAAKLRGDGQSTRPKVIADLQVRPDAADVAELVAAAQTSVAQGAEGIRLILPAPYRQIASVVDALVPDLRADLPIVQPLGADLRTRFGLPAARNRYAAAA